jgi:unsaturated rhamnogalacturonyl hydrolase
MFKTKNLLFILLVFLTIKGHSQKLPANKAIISKMTLANSYFMKKWPDVGKEIYAIDKTRPSNIWTRAVYYEGLMALNDVSPNKKYVNYAIQWGDFHKWGLRNGVGTRNADDQACGQTYIDLYLKDKSHPERIAKIKANVDSMLTSHKIDDWSWIDALQMAMPVFAKLGVVYNDEKYFEKMFQMYMYTKNVEGLYSDQEFLWYRDKSFLPPYKTPKGQNCFWSRGNGWVIAALVRVMDTMPTTAPHYDEYLDTYREMMIALLNLQRPDGFWNVSLTDQDDFGGKELSGTALITYGMAWGIRNEKIDSTTFTPIVAKAMNAMLTDCVHKNGFLGWVQGTGKEPKDGQPLAYDKEPNFDDFGLGCFLLAGSEVVKLNKKK